MNIQSKQKIFCLILAILSISLTHAQVEKGYWLAGGSLSLNAGESTYEKSSLLVVSPKIGYFLIDKLATGINIRVERNSNKIKGTIGEPRVLNTTSAGPLVRYYLLQNDLPINVFAEGSVLFGKVTSSLGGGYGTFQYIFNGGINIFFTQSAALDFSIGYQSTKWYSTTPGGFKSLMVGIGFQVHLIKDK